MKYKVIVDGGFTGIRRTYEGDVSLDEEERKILLSALRESHLPTKPPLNDGEQYSWFLENDDDIIEAIFDEQNHPPALRKFLEQIKADQ
ncbi:hypothetical protein PP178_08080 [Zeaxanthinibacter sp. PT1]|uniref:hypothetical protein n=1 Tax=Zeaxanthinibacter TaxID=561554 RepID=UPI00234A1B21|nr:hypothetical protein [Zeaxanthinibacter sp. PT1]MDC6351510.1 hypothetical protein [Zeaxanthinibacter sp. PT1]